MSSTETATTAHRILDVAEELVQTRGVNGMSYADISARLGITKASLHYHFASKADLVRPLGADEVIDYTRDEIDCHGARYDVVIDTAGNRPLSLLRRALTTHGTLVLVGGEHGGGRVLGGFDRQLRAPLVSMFVGQRLRGLVAKERAEDLEAATRLIEAGAVTPAIDRSYPLVDAPDAIRYLAGGHAAGKVVVTV